MHVHCDISLLKRYILLVLAPDRATGGWAFTRYDHRTDGSDWSVRRSYRVNASFDRSDRRSEESNMFDFVRLPIRLSKRVDTTSDWSDRPAGRTTNHAAA